MCRLCHVNASYSQQRSTLCLDLRMQLRVAPVQSRVDFCLSKHSDVHGIYTHSSSRCASWFTCDCVLIDLLFDWLIDCVACYGCDYFLPKERRLCDHECLDYLSVCVCVCVCVLVGPQLSKMWTDFDGWSGKGRNVEIWDRSVSLCGFWIGPIRIILFGVVQPLSASYALNRVSKMSASFSSITESSLNWSS